MRLRIMLISVVPVLLCGLLLASSADAQASSEAGKTKSGASANVPAAAASSPALALQADQVMAAPAKPTTEYTLSPDKLAKATALYNLGSKLLVIDLVWSFVVLLGILYLGIGARFRDWAEKAAQYSFPQAMIFVPLLVLTITILGWPLDAYRHSVRLQYGLSVQGWGSWFGDVLKGEAITLVLGTFLLWLMVFIIRRSPLRWWFYFWLCITPIVIALTFLAPIIIDPLFNDFKPLEKTNPQLVEAIERVTTRAGVSIPRNRMYLMEASKKVTTLNAYVTGFGASKRVVIWDTTIQKATIPETLFVVGHEMGHYVLNHIVIGIAATIVGLFIGFYILFRLSGWCLARFDQRWQIRELGDWAAVPMILLIFSILTFISTPIQSTVSRMFEHNADVYGLEVTHGINANSQEAGAHAFQVLGELSYSYPYPSKLVVFWYYDHPAIPDRVRFAHEYDPWTKGQQPKYVK